MWYENRPFPDIGAVEQEYTQPLPEPKRFTLTPGTMIHDVTFADVALPGTISGTHFLDLDRDGVQDEGEIGIPNSEVELIAAFLVRTLLSQLMLMKQEVFTPRILMATVTWTYYQHPKETTKSLGTKMMERDFRF